MVELMLLRLTRMADLTVIGGGLAGCEAAWQAAQQGLEVILYEMRPFIQTGAHQTAGLAELVCSNSLGSNLVDRASGLLKDELRRMRSMLLDCADTCAIPAGSALAVDRKAFSELVTRKIEAHHRIHVVREEVKTIPLTPTIIASGPLTSPALTHAIQEITGQENLYFYDAIAPIVLAESIDMNIAFRATRRHRDAKSSGEGDYLNCPLGREQYYTFVDNLSNASHVSLHDFEHDLLSSTGVKAGAQKYFEACLPIEVLASRHPDALAYGPMRPIGLIEPKSKKRPYAVVQLRQDNLAGDLYNMVGFQTNLTYLEQKRVFRMIPGLEHAEFIRFGQMHRNSFIASPLLLETTLQFRYRENLFFAGQITGVEGYMGNIATGLLAGLNAVCFVKGEELLEFPRTTMLGSLCYYITHAEMKNFQPMKANFGILPSLPSHIIGKHMRSIQYALRAQNDLKQYLELIKDV